MKQRGETGRFVATLGPKVCPVCDQRFQPRSVTQKFCSRPCMYAGRRVLRGADNPRFNGGISHLASGRKVKLLPGGGMMTYARWLMQEHLGCDLTADEVVHHRNGDFTDDRIENLEVLSRAEHIDHHRPELHAARGIAA